MRVLLAPMPAALRLQLRRLLRDVPGVDVVGQMLSSSSLPEAVGTSGAQCLLLDAGQLTLALLQDALKHAAISQCLLLHTGTYTAIPGLPVDRKLTLLQRPVTLDDEAAQGGFAKGLRQQLGAQAEVLPQRQAPRPSEPPATRGFDVLAIGSSTGGPQALQLLFAGLAGAGLPLAFPIVVTQHMTAGFVGALAQSLQDNSGIPSHEAADGLVLQPGHAYLAAGGRHLRLETQGLQLVCRLDDGPPENYCKPAVDVMLRSLAQKVSLRTLVVILTGMGQDGLLGCRQLHAGGSTILAQDQASSVVWGMPGAVAQAGICHAVLAPEQIALRVRESAGA